MLRSASAFVFGITRAIVNAYLRDIHRTRRLKPGTNLFNGGTTRLLLSLNAAGINKGKESYAPQAWIQVCSARDHLNAIPQSILIRALCL